MFLMDKFAWTEIIGILTQHKKYIVLFGKTASQDKKQHKNIMLDSAQELAVIMTGMISEQTGLPPQDTR